MFGGKTPAHLRHTFKKLGETPERDGNVVLDTGVFALLALRLLLAQLTFQVLDHRQVIRRLPQLADDYNDLFSGQRAVLARDIDYDRDPSNILEPVARHIAGLVRGPSSHGCNSIWLGKIHRRQDRFQSDLA